MKNRFDKSLKLFEEIYFMGKELCTHNYFIGGDKSEYWSKAKYIDTGFSDGKSAIFGRSAFCPRIICRRAKPNSIKYNKAKGIFEGNRFFLTLDPQGCYDADFAYYWDANRENIKEREIDVTDMSKKDIMQEVERMLNMSNQEIMTRFNIQDVGSANIKIELLVDDLVYDYLESKQQDFVSGAYDSGLGIRTVFGMGSVQQRRDAIKEKKYSEILINPDGQDPFSYKDYIKYNVLDAEEIDIDKIRIKIEEANVSSEMGKKILEMLQERFSEKKTKEGNVTKTQDLLFEECINLGKSTDLRDAEQHLIEAFTYTTYRKRDNEEMEQAE